MKSKLLMVAGVLLTIMAVLYLSARSHLASTIFSDIFSLAILALVIGGSIYKIALLWRYRHDPGRRRQVIFSTQLYPASWRKFFYDEETDAAKKP